MGREILLAFISCGQEENVIGRHPSFRHEIEVPQEMEERSEDGETTKEILLKYNVNLLKKCGYTPIILSDCAHRRQFPYDAFTDKEHRLGDDINVKLNFHLEYLGIGHALFKEIENFLDNSIIIDGAYKLTENFINEIKSQPIPGDAIYPMYDKETIRIYKFKKEFSEGLKAHYKMYYNGMYYNNTDHFTRTNFEIDHMKFDNDTIITSYKTNEKLEKFI